MAEEQTQARRQRGRTRGRPSSIDQLPEDLRVELNAALRERRVTQTDLREWLNEQLQERGLDQEVSYSALNRYSQFIEDKMGMRRDVQEAARAIVGPLEEAGKSDMGRALTETLKTLTFDLLMKADSENGEPMSHAMIKNLAVAVEKMEKAAFYGVERELKIRREVLDKAAAEVDKVAKKSGLTADTVNTIKSAILGVEAQ